MSSINGVPPTVAAAYLTPTNPPAPARAAAASRDAVLLDTMPATPPPEVLAAIAQAATAPERLAASGQALRFKVDEATGHVQVEVHDLHGNLLFTAPSSKALHIADGGTP